MNEADLTTVFTAARFKLGERYDQLDSSGRRKTFEFSKRLTGAASIVANAAVIHDSSNGDQFQVEPSSAVNQIVKGVAETAVTTPAPDADQFFFIVVGGKATVNVAGSAAADKVLVTTAVAGRLDEAANAETDTDYTQQSIVSLSAESSNLLTAQLEL